MPKGNYLSTSPRHAFAASCARLFTMDSILNDASDTPQRYKRQFRSLSGLLSSSPERKRAQVRFVEASSDSSDLDPIHSDSLEALFESDSSTSMHEIINPLPTVSRRRVFRVDHGQEKVDAIIQAALENGSADVNLDSCALTNVPDEINDLKNMVSHLGADQGKLTSELRLILSNNAITRLPPFLFTVWNISVLSLRNNKLKSIPTAIYRLRNLRDLSLGGNLLDSIPSQILDLPHLEVVVLFPNPFRALRPKADRTRSAIARATSDISHLKAGKRPATKVYTTMPELYDRTITHLTTSDLHAPKLTELCLRVLGRHPSIERTHKQLTSSSDNLLPAQSLNRIASGIDAMKQGSICGICLQGSMVEPIGVIYEEWDNVFGNNGITVRREICSGKCLKRAAEPTLV
ncbi:hypothetical protein CANCADRAFT_98047 [Tortispora caseinolytica NRRL Y-17796]|uniref:Uncharacterized protein n=1 Tax=Tortispora caseinolytica NRRL Y-17796 TaxID=767744 RepID=A0A1E4TDS9_9ASCO|nr:hypothetical protein CANCADRAFT_98047 [Tortispora caseinolytica NRRL Y-17796]